MSWVSFVIDKGNIPQKIVQRHCDQMLQVDSPSPIQYAFAASSQLETLGQAAVRVCLQVSMARQMSIVSKEARPKDQAWMIWATDVLED